MAEGQGPAVRLTAAELEAKIAAVPRREPTPLPSARMSAADAPLSLATSEPLSPDAFGSLPTLPAEEIERMRREEEAQAREAWDTRFDLARASVPEKFSWVPTLRPPFDVLGSTFPTALPWLRAGHLRRLLDAWKSPQNILLCGDVGAGKTTLLVVLARWTLAAAGYDAPAIRKRREEIVAELSRGPGERRRHVLPDPEHLSQVRQAQHARFLSATDLLDTQGQKPNASAVEAAQRMSVLFIDEIGKELKGAPLGSYLSQLRTPAIDTIIEHAWNTKRRWFGTTRFMPEDLANMYDLGTYRRLVEEESGVTVIDLNGPEWAGPYLREKAARARGKR